MQKAESYTTSDHFRTGWQETSICSFSRSQPLFRLQIHHNYIYFHAPQNKSRYSTFSTSSILPDTDTDTRIVTPNRSFIDLKNAPPGYDTQWAVVYENFISKDEHESLIKDVSNRMRRKRYEKGHWDAVIDGFKESELIDPVNDGVESFASTPLSNVSSDLILRVRDHIEKNHILSSPDSENDSVSSSSSSSKVGNVRWLPCHAIDLGNDGTLSAHVDSVKFSGDIVSGLSLVSSSIMRLRPAASEKDKDGNSAGAGYVDIYLPPMSLYVLSGGGRFDYTHELLPCGAIFETENGKKMQIAREKRVSIIFRDAKQ